MGFISVRKGWLIVQNQCNQLYSLSKEENHIFISIYVEISNDRVHAKNPQKNSRGEQLKIKSYS